MSRVTLDEKNRVLLDRKIRKTAGLKKGTQMVAIPFKGGVILVEANRKNFARSLTGFSFQEERHEASKFLFKEAN